MSLRSLTDWTIAMMARQHSADLLHTVVKVNDWKQGIALSGVHQGMSLLSLTEWMMATVPWQYSVDLQHTVVKVNDWKQGNALSVMRQGLTPSICLTAHTRATGTFIYPDLHMYQHRQKQFSLKFKK